MNYLGPKRGRLRLNSELYDHLRNQVLRRDGWRCQACGTMSNLEVYHTLFRSQSGHDPEGNLITLCARCHARFIPGLAGMSVENPACDFQGELWC